MCKLPPRSLATIFLSTRGRYYKKCNRSSWLSNCILPGDNTTGVKPHCVTTRKNSRKMSHFIFLYCIFVGVLFQPHFVEKSWYLLIIVCKKTGWTFIRLLPQISVTASNFQVSPKCKPRKSACDIVRSDDANFGLHVRILASRLEKR